MAKQVEKVYERVILTPYKEDGYESLTRAVDKFVVDMEELKNEGIPGYNDQYVVRLTIEKLEE